MELGKGLILGGFAGPALSSVFNYFMMLTTIMLMVYFDAREKKNPSSKKSR